MCVAVFFLKDRDLKSEVKKRNIQPKSLRRI
jgi:tight adherence protein C